MKRLILFCTNEEVKELFNYCTKDFKNSLIKYDSSNHNFYFFSHYNESYEQVEISYNILQFDNNLINVIKEILKTSYQKIKEISDEPFGPFVEDEIYSEIFSYVNKCCYEGNEPKSIFEFVANIFYKYLLGHKMKNGNKRLSLLFLINLLRYFGYHFYWSEGEFKNYRNHKVSIEKWVEKLSSANKLDFSTKINELIKWIKENCVIAILFR